MLVSSRAAQADVLTPGMKVDGGVTKEAGIAAVGQTSKPWPVGLTLNYT